jgi:hypothetical protein
MKEGKQKEGMDEGRKCRRAEGWKEDAGRKKGRDEERRER